MLWKTLGKTLSNAKNTNKQTKKPPTPPNQGYLHIACRDKQKCLGRACRWEKQKDFMNVEWRKKKAS